MNSIDGDAIYGSYVYISFGGIIHDLDPICDQSRDLDLLSLFNIEIVILLCTSMEQVAFHHKMNYLIIQEMLLSGLQNCLIISYSGFVFLIQYNFLLITIRIIKYKLRNYIKQEVE